MMRWADLDLDARWWTIPAEYTKNGLQHGVPLKKEAVDILKTLRKWTGAAEHRDQQRPGAEGSKAMGRLREAWGVTDLCAHDLRRTVASLMSQPG